MATALRRFSLFSTGRNVRILAQSFVNKSDYKSVRFNSSLVNLDIKDSVAVMELNRKPVNSFSMDFIEEITSSLQGLEKNSDVRGLILTSGCNKVFSAGLDLVNEIHNCDAKRLSTFWGLFRDMFMQLYNSRLVTIAAVNGHAIAGGCVLSLACDYRIMASGNYTIGLNETAAGIQVPYWVAQTLVHAIGYREAEKASLLSTLFPVDGALAKGLVDKVVSQDELMAESHKEMEKWLKIPDLGRVLTKQNLRSDFLQKMRDTQEQDIKGFADYILLESTQKLIQEQIDRIKNKSKK